MVFRARLGKERTNNDHDLSLWALTLSLCEYLQVPYLTLPHLSISTLYTPYSVDPFFILLILFPQHPHTYATWSFGASNQTQTALLPTRPLHPHLPHPHRADSSRNSPVVLPTTRPKDCSPSTPPVCRSSRGQGADYKLLIHSSLHVLAIAGRHEQWRTCGWRTWQPCRHRVYSARYVSWSWT
jgi:hypothetical protein